MAFLFEKLDVYNLSLEFNNKIIGICKSKKLQGYYYIANHVLFTSI